MYKIIPFILFNVILSSNCDIFADHSYIDRSIYSLGDTLSFEDQNLLYPVCVGDDNYNNDDSLSFTDLNGNLNSDYKITIISMNATW